MKQHRRDSLIAGAVTILCMAALVILLLFGRLDTVLPQLAESSVPEISMIPDDDERLIEPELLQELGEEDAVTHDAPAPDAKGNPKPAEEDNSRKIEPGKNTKPAPVEDRRISSKHKNDVKAPEPPESDKERREVTSRMAKAFGGANGAREGKSGTSGAGGTGTGISGVASGRVFKGCPKPSVSLRNKTVVVVDVNINADGAVTYAKARGGAAADIRRACEAAARAARWSAKPDAGDTKGSITFTITPR